MINIGFITPNSGRVSQRQPFVEMSTHNVYKQIRRFRKVLNLFKELIFGNKNGKN